MFTDRVGREGKAVGIVRLSVCPVCSTYWRLNLGFCMVVLHVRNALYFWHFIL